MPSVKYCYLCGRVDKSLSLHKFPKAINLRDMWLKVCELNESDNLTNVKLCSKHFKVDDFIDLDAGKWGGHKTLKNNVVPSIGVPVAIPNASYFECTFSSPKSSVCEQENSAGSSGMPSFETTASSSILMLENQEVAETNVAPFSPQSTPKRRIKSNKVDKNVAPQFHDIQSTPKIRRFSDPRYVSEIGSFDMKTPRRAKRAIQLAKSVVLQKSKQIRALQESNRYLKKRVKSLRDLVLHLENKNLVSSDAANNLMDTIPEEFKSIISRKSNMKYSANIRSFALTLQFYSSKAYCYVRKIWNNLLPHPSTIKKWYSVVDGSPGFTKEAFTSIKLLNKKNGIILNLVVDEMSIQEQSIFVSGEFSGQVNLGTSSIEVPDNTVLAKNVLVFMAVALNSYWKVPLGYFFIKGAERANLLCRCLELIQDTGAKVFSITFDGAATNINMCTEMGANLTYSDSFKPWFINPYTSEQIYVFYDACHMFKLIRNTLGDKKTIIHNNKKISWDYIKELPNIQKDEGLHCGAKLTNKHIAFNDNKMNVKLAVQALSRSTSKALNFLREIKYSKMFENSDATAEFCLNFNNAFDILNVKGKFCKSPFKMPLNNENYETLYDESQRIIKYIEALIDINGQPLIKGLRKTGFIGLIVNLTNIFELYKTVTPQMEYLLTIELSQDFLETFFSAIRIRGGFNNNPNAKQFEHAYKRLLVRHQIHNFDNSNVLADGIEILNISSDRKILKNANNLDFFNESECLSNDIFDHDYIYTMWNLNAYVENVVKYISGFVAKKPMKQINCCTCSEQLRGETNGEPILIKMRNRGGLICPSEDVIKICLETEKKIREYNSEIFIRKNLKNILCNAVLRNLNLNCLFQGPVMDHHSTEQDVLEQHKLLLIKLIINTYLNVRLFYEAKKKSEKRKR